jgi:hypothetical protein
MNYDFFSFIIPAKAEMTNKIKAAEGSLFLFLFTMITNKK